MSKRRFLAAVFPCAILLAGLPFLASAPAVAEDHPVANTAESAGGQWGRDSGGAAPVCLPAALGSPYMPVDSWVYPAMLRLYSLGFVDNVFLGMRPWTRSSMSHMLEEAGARIEDADAGPVTDEAQEIYDALMHELRNEMAGPCMPHQGKSRIESVYTVIRSISGTPLRDSYHLGSTIINDYGRPLQSGFNNYSGASGYAAAGRFVFYARGEFEAAPSATGYSQALAHALSTVDSTSFLNPVTNLPYPQATIPMGPIADTATGRVMEAYISANLLNHEISFGKQDNWLGPGLGGGMAYSNNAENIYSFRINRVEPLHIPLISRLTGPFRYDFLVGKLRGHTFMPNPANPGGTNPNLPNVINPGDPWVHIEKISFRPTENLEFGFERTVIWGGEGHAPITFRTFAKSFISMSSPGGNAKDGRDDPGARFGAFDFSYRLPFVRNWLTLYADSEVHDDISPADAPRRAAYRPGIYLSHVPGIPQLDLRVEAVSTDPSSSDHPTPPQGPSYPSHYGQFMYYEGIQKQGYTNQGQLFGDWIGREDKGGQAWITWHLSGNEWIQIGLRNQKATKYFIPGSTTQTIPAGSPGCPVTTACLAPGGTTLNDINFNVVKRIGKDFEINGNFVYEHWKAQIYLPGQQTVTATTIQLTWFPGRKVSF
ncbi:MAG TPA: capsule assembly Wzi family protein [Terracidiphilus sp.]|nr:capsule assembly Wzi family protein [Terracidiphilus sp.]